MVEAQSEQGWSDDANPYPYPPSDDTPATIESSWLASRSRGDCPAGAVFLHAPRDRFPAQRRRRESTGADRAPPGIAGPVRPAVLAVDRSTSNRPGCSTSSGCPAEGARAFRPDGPHPAASRSSSRRSAGMSPSALAALSGSASPAESGGPVGLVPEAPHEPGPLLAARAPPPGRCHPAQLDRRGEPVGMPLFGVARERLHVVLQRGAPGVPRHGVARGRSGSDGGSDPLRHSRSGGSSRRENTLGLVRAELRRLGATVSP